VFNPDDAKRSWKRIYLKERWKIGEGMVSFGKVNETKRNKRGSVDEGKEMGKFEGDISTIHTDMKMSEEWEGGSLHI
jgi:hypothetical protein